MILSSSQTWSAASGVVGGQDVIAALEHEISEGALGRVSSLGVYGIGGVAEWAPMDFFRYDANGAFDPKYNTGKPIYFSVDGSGVNSSTSYQFNNSSSGGDFADWIKAGPDANASDPFGPGPSASTDATLSATDLQVMEALGWTPPSELAAGSTVQLSSATASRGGSDKLTFSVVNNGLGSSHSFQVGIYLSTDSTISTSDTLIGVATLDGVAYGKTDTYTVDFSLPSNIALGNYHVGVIVDYNNQLIDSNRSNNASGSATVTITKPTYVWQSAESGDWSATGWAANGALPIPGAGDVADMSVTGAPYTVLVDNYTTTVTGGGTQTYTDFAVDGVILGADTTLEIDPNSFQLETSAFNSGDILIDNTLTVGDGAANAVVTFADNTSAGKVTLNDADTATLTGATAGTTLDLHGQTIQGGGSITNMQLVVYGNSVIDATGSNHELTLNTGSAILNEGVLEATGSSGLVIEDEVVNQGPFSQGDASGFISASGVAAHVDLISAHIEGGSLDTSDQGVLQVMDPNSVIDGSTTAGAVTNLGYVLAKSGDTLTLKGAILNSGTIAVQGGTALTIDPSSEVDLNSAAGGSRGQIALDDSPGNAIEGVGGAAATLRNIENTISGSGQFANLDIINMAGGVIDATGANYQLVIDSSDTLMNSGLVEATGAAGLSLSGQTIDGSEGGVVTVGAGSQIDIFNDTFKGFTFAAAGNGKWVISDPNNVLDGSTPSGAVTIATTLTANAGDTLTLKGTIHNEGKIALTEGTALAIDPIAGVTLDSGGKTTKGVVTLDDSPGNAIEGLGGVAATLTNVDNTISGSGQFADLTIVNKAGGVIDATGAKYQLIIDSSDTLKNSGLVEATGAAGLSLSGQTIDASAGGVVTVGDGSLIDIFNDTFKGGTLAATGSGKWVIADANNVLDGSTPSGAVTIATTLTANAGDTLTLKGTIHNEGKIALTGGTALAIDPAAGVTLDSGGKTTKGVVTLDDSPGNALEGVGGVAATLTNVDNTISGSGQFADLTIVNKAGGVIDATGAKLSAHYRQFGHAEKQRPRRGDRRGGVVTLRSDDRRGHWRRRHGRRRVADRHLQRYVQGRNIGRDGQRQVGDRRCEQRARRFDRLRRGDDRDDADRERGRHIDAQGDDPQRGKDRAHRGHGARHRSRRRRHVGQRRENNQRRRDARRQPRQRHRRPRRRRGDADQRRQYDLGLRAVRRSDDRQQGRRRHRRDRRELSARHQQLGLAEEQRPRRGDWGGGTRAFQRHDLQRRRDDCGRERLAGRFDV